MAQLEYKGWTFHSEDEEDGEGFYTDQWYALKDGERKNIHHSRFRFTPTLERLAFFVDNDFPSFPQQYLDKGLYCSWDDDDIDKALEQMRSEA